ncbi:MAG TPA: aromatic ring-hydroxylating dioxygenase subunit alpha [Rubrobacteraceae bacterium]|nr:aromatic ring-hydroxylating dioxygenase subunit alpha [Rubrobacteraceae bacterium]
MTIDRADPYTRPRPNAAEDYTREETYEGTRAPVDFAVTLLPEAYTDPEFHAIERERIFAASWIVVGCVSEVERSGQVIVAEVAGRSIIVTRDKAGRLQAFHNVCRHRAARLLDYDCREVRNNRIRCPYHSWTYDLEGNCLGTPLFEGSDIPEDQRAVFDMGGVKGFDKADYGLMPVSVDTWGFLVFVNLDPDAAPLAEQLGDLPGRLGGYGLEEWRIVQERRYEVRADYKLVGENFMEYYHLPWVHPELVQVSRVEDHYRSQGPGMYMGFRTTPILQNTGDGGFLGLPPLSTLGGEDAVSGRFIWLFPNVAVNVLPSHAFIIIANPDGPRRTVERTVILAHPECTGAPGAEGEIEQLMHFWDLVNLQDIEIVERVQEGISNPAYRGGRMCYRFEEPLHRFQNMVIDKMVGIDRVPPGDDEDETPMFGDSAESPGGGRGK